MEPFSALLLSVDPVSLATVKKILEEHGISVKAVATVQAAEQLIRTIKFDLGVFDYDVPEALNVAAGRVPRGNPKMVFALLRASHLKDVRGKGVHFVVQKPFTADLFARSLRAGFGTMIRARRVAFRHPVQIQPVSSILLQEQGNQVLHSSVVLDLSQTGLCIQTQEILPQGATLQIDFHLPKTGELIHATGSVMWTRASGRTGIKFTHVPPAEQKHLTTWLDSRLPFDLESIPRTMPPASHRERMAEISV